MYIVDVETKKGKIRGIALQNDDGVVAIVTEIDFKSNKKWFRKTINMSYEAFLLKPIHYTSYTILKELGSFEKTCMYQMLNDELKEKFSLFYRNELFKADIFWNKTRSFIEDHELTLTELSIIHELFRDGYAKENIVGLELNNDGKRISFNLTDQSSVQSLIALIRRAVIHAECLVNSKRSKIIENILYQLKNDMIL
jgi:hypothetical protein